VSWLEDFTAGETVWRQLMSAPTFAAFLEATSTLSDWEMQFIVLYHGIAEKQAAGEEWPSASD